MQRVVVTGATGQIGSELVVELREIIGGDNVLALGHSRRPGPKMERSGPYIALDITDREALEAAIKEFAPDALFHLAAVLSGVGESDPPRVWNLNVGGLQNVLETARKNQLRVFWPSSIGVFGRGYPRDRTPQETVLLPITMYGVTKVTGELLCDYYHRKYGVDVRSVRYPGIISTETLPGGGTTDYAVEIFYEAIKHRRYRCFVREDTRLPMMYMPDCIDAAMKIMLAPESRISRRDAYNVDDLNFSAGELAAEIQRYLPDLQVSYEPDYRQTIADSWPHSLDDSEARRDWGWSPKHDLRSMTKDMLTKLERKHKEGLF